MEEEEKNNKFLFNILSNQREKKFMLKVIFLSKPIFFFFLSEPTGWGKDHPHSINMVFVGDEYLVGIVGISQNPTEADQVDQTGLQPSWLTRIRWNSDLCWVGRMRSNSNGVGQSKRVWTSLVSSIVAMAYSYLLYASIYLKIQILTKSLCIKYFILV